MSKEFYTVTDADCYSHCVIDMVGRTVLLVVTEVHGDDLRQTAADAATSSVLHGLGILIIWDSFQASL